MAKKKEQKEKVSIKEQGQDLRKLFTDESLYNQAIERKQEVTIRLVSGEEVKGYLLSETKFTLTVSDGKKIRLMYKHALKEVIFEP